MIWHVQLLILFDFNDFKDLACAEAQIFDFKYVKDLAWADVELFEFQWF